MRATDLVDARMDERVLHQRMEWFFKKYAPADRRKAAEFHADLAMVVQAVHRDAGKEAHAMLCKLIEALPPPSFGRVTTTPPLDAPVTIIPTGPARQGP